MNPITERYERSKTRGSMKDHQVILKRVADQCRHVTEFGVRDGDGSTLAFLASRCPIVVSYDVEWPVAVKELQADAAEAGANWFFYWDNVLLVDIQPTEFLFLDTNELGLAQEAHTPKQLLAELEMHGDKASKFLGCHDTHQFKDLQRAFLTWGLNNGWELYYHSPECFGLTLLKRPGVEVPKGTALGA